MAQLIQPFNAHNFDPTQGTGSLPIGRHPVIVESSEVKANKANDGGYLQLNLKVIDGPQAGVVGAHRLNLYHSNPQTVEIANRQLSAISHVTGVYMIQDSAQLHNIPFMVEVGPQKNDPQYTEVKRVFDANGNEPGKSGQGGGAAQPGQGQGQGAGQGAAGGWGNQNAGQQGQQQGQGQQGGNPGGWGQGQQGQQGQNPGQGGGWGGQGAGQGQGQQQPQNGQGQGQPGGWGGNQQQGNPGQGQGGPGQGQGGWGGAPNGGQGQQQQPNNGGGAGGWQQNQGGGNGGAPWGAQG